MESYLWITIDDNKLMVIEMNCWKWTEWLSSPLIVLSGTVSEVDSASPVDVVAEIIEKAIMYSL